MPEFGHRILNWIGLDLVELGFRLVDDEHARWCTAGFSCGLRLAALEPSSARRLLREFSPGANANASTGAVLSAVGNRPLTVTDELSKVRKVFSSLLRSPPEEILPDVRSLGSLERLAWWFRHSVVWGIHAGLNADALFTGRMLAFLERLPVNQRFICDRLTHIVRNGHRHHRSALIELIDYTYPSQSLERATITKAATQTLKEAQRWNKIHDPAHWILCGFRDGLILSTRNSELRERLFAESSRDGMKATWELFHEHIGLDATGWHPKRIVGEAIAWLQGVHPKVSKPDCSAAEFECIRHLFDFAFWMGLAAGAATNSV